MSQTVIFWPVAVMALVTLFLNVPMFRARVAATKSGKAKTSDFRLRTAEPDESAKIVNAITNQYETPVLYYAACIIAFVTGNATVLVIALAWLYGILKIAHIGLFVTSNRLRWRMPVFSLALLVLFIMWLVLAFLLISG